MPHVDTSQDLGIVPQPIGWGRTVFQQQLEPPIRAIAQLLHHYSIAHGGPRL